MQTSHTPGTIHQGQGNGEGSIFTDTEGARRGTDGGCTLSPLFIVNGKTPEDDANARRLVAAWNACEGLDTDLLADMGAGTFVRHADRFYALRKAADAAAKCLDDLLGEDAGDARADAIDAAYQPLRAALDGTADFIPAKLAEQRDAYRAALQRIADAGPENEPTADDYEDGEDARNFGEDLTAWEAAKIARGALAGGPQ